MRVVLVGLVVALAGCRESVTAPTTPLNTQITVSVGETTTIREASLRLTFVGVLNDSRCPADAVCILGGDALVRISVDSNGGGPAVYDLHTGSLDPVRHAELTIALVELSPYPFSARPIASGDYRATFRVIR